MRDYKFRGQKINSNAWVYGSYFHIDYNLHPNHKWLSEACVTMDRHVIMEIEGLEHVVKPETVGQGIGLEDDFGREVYVGHVVILDSRKIGGGKYQGVVVWNSNQVLGNLGFGLVTDKGYLPTDFLGDLKIVGNSDYKKEGE